MIVVTIEDRLGAVLHEVPAAALTLVYRTTHLLLLTLDPCTPYIQLDLSLHQDLAVLLDLSPH